MVTTFKVCLQKRNETTARWRYARVVNSYTAGRHFAAVERTLAHTPSPESSRISLG